MSISIKKTCILSSVEANILHETLIRTNKVFSKIKKYENIEDLHRTTNKFIKKVDELEETLQEISNYYGIKYKKGALLTNAKNSMIRKD
ncbi:hypothetical protein [Campylobacter sp. MG1]|uniref:hypothetical protein n=1 Tax=Campylobacter sp. MG1 TaxID=2976332 RepID=UPI00226CF702|nr:hypothetical protein [Campylobacter sp. MG1]